MLQALDFVRENMTRRITESDVCEAVGRSPSVFRARIKQETGVSFRNYLRRLRMEEARRLLTQTRRSIGEVAKAVGFVHLSHFSRVFHAETGLSPREYRDRSRRPAAEGSPPSRQGRPSLIYREDFREKEFRDRWEILDGDWKVEEGALHGRSAIDLFVGLRSELPRDSEVRMSLRRVGGPPPLSGARLMLGVCDGSRVFTRGYRFTLGFRGNRSHLLARGGKTVALEPGAFTDKAWHDIRIRASEGLTLAVDGADVLRYDELYPLPWRERGFFVVGGVASTYEVRSFEVYSLSPPRSESPIALADAQVAEEEYQAALDVYEDELGKVENEGTKTDLLLKIGMTYLNLGLSIRARSYLQRFSERRIASSWGLLASFEALRPRLHDFSIPELQREIRSRTDRAVSPGMLQLAIEFIQDLSGECRERGDVERAFALEEIIFDISPDFSLHAARAPRAATGCLFSADRFEEAAAFARRAVGSGRLDEEQRARVELGAALPLGALGRYREARRMLLGCASTKDPGLRAFAEITESIVLQAEGRLGEAVRHYLSIPRRFPTVESQVRTALDSSALLVGLTDTNDPDSVWPRLCRESGAGERFPQPEHVRRVLHCRAKRYDTLVPQIAEDVFSRRELTRNVIADHVLLSILYELSGDERRAQRNLGTLERTAAKGPLWRWVLPATYLLGRTSLDELRANVRGTGLFNDLSASSTFYMLAVVERQRGREQEAGELLRAAVEADPLNYWAAVQARRELDELTPPMKAFLGT